MNELDYLLNDLATIVFDLQRLRAGYKFIKSMPDTPNKTLWLDRVQYLASLRLKEQDKLIRRLITGVYR